MIRLAVYNREGQEVENLKVDEAAFGVIGLETALALIWDRLVITNQITAMDMVRLFCSGPRQVVGLPLPRIKAGESVDLTIFHPEEKWTVDPKDFFSLSVNSPFKGWELTGRPWGIMKGNQWAGRVEPAF